MQANGAHDLLVRELLALLRLEESVSLGDATEDWGGMCILNDSTTEAQLHSSAAIGVNQEDSEYNAKCTVGRVRWLHLLRHLPHLKRLNVSAWTHLIGDQEAVALSDTLQHLDLQVPSSANVSPARHVFACTLLHRHTANFCSCVRSSAVRAIKCTPQVTASNGRHVVALPAGNRLGIF